MKDEKHYHIGSDLNCHWDDGTVTKPEEVSLGEYGESICMSCELNKLSYEAMSILKKYLPKEGTDDSWIVCDRCYRGYTFNKIDRSSKN